MSRAECRQLQELLIARGYAIGEADGKIGPATRAAIAEAEKSVGMEPTGRAGQKITVPYGAGEAQRWKGKRLMRDLAGCEPCSDR